MIKGDNQNTNTPRLFGILAICIFLSGLAIIFLLNYTIYPAPLLSNLIKSFLSSLLLTSLVCPLLVIFVFRPLLLEIAKRKHVDAELQKLSEFNRAILEVLPLGMDIVDEEGNILFASKNLEAIFGKDMIGKKCWTLYKDNKQQCLDCPLKKGVAIRETSTVEATGVLGGRVLEIFHTGMIYQNKKAILEIFVDLTEQKKTEEKIRQTAEELARSNNELEQFAYVASHDLQEPLRMVTSYVELLEKRYKDRLDANAGEFIAFAVSGAKRMQELIEDLLTYSRVGKRKESFELIDCEDVLKEALLNLKVAIEESGAIITHNRLPTVMGDATHLIQLFQNLIGNSIKFRSKDPLSINVSAEQKENEWVFSVHDNGIGFDPKHAERIFIIFQRLHTSTEYPGTGIGLAICRKIVERHGGHIWAGSEPGKGSKFYFTIPAKGG